MQNPFNPSTDPVRREIWRMLVIADSQAFVDTNWSLIEPDFDAEHFEGIRCSDSADPDNWQIAFPRLEDYRDSWLKASRDYLAKPKLGMTHLEAVLKRIDLRQIDIAGDRALAHKKFSGTIPLADGSAITASRQSLYRLHRQQGRWKIVGFLGQLPLD
jgi:hypothetical protein